MTNTQAPDKRDDSETQVELKTTTQESQEDKNAANQQMETNEPQPQYNITTGPGEHLRRIREKKQMSVKDVADSLHLEVRIIEMLEKDNYKSGIPSIFLKGYIRNYAKLMGISPEPLIAVFDDGTKPKDKNSKPTPTPKPKVKTKKQVKSNDLWPKLVTLAILLTLIIFIALWQFSPPNEKVVHDENTAKFNESSRTPPPPTRETDETADSANQTQTAATSPEETLAAAQQPIATTPSEVTPPVAPVEPKPKDHTIHVTFKGTVWMRITDSKDKRLFQGTGKKGKSLTLKGTPPYRVRVGNYNDVDIEYQGNVKDVKDYPKYQNNLKTFLIGGEE